MRRSKRPGAHARRAGAIATLQATVLAGAAGAALLGFLALWRDGRTEPVLVGVAAALLALATWRQRRAQRWRIGQRSERAVQRRLRRLERRGWTVTHDVARGRGNVDHLVVGPDVAYAIETKTTRRGPRELAQARANAAWASRRLSRPVIAVLCVTQRPQRARIVDGVVCVDSRRLARALARSRRWR
ncbi:MAG: nuclease-related domain-containing protein [Thermoleophilia bacterium]